MAGGASQHTVSEDYSSVTTNKKLNWFFVWFLFRKEQIIPVRTLKMLIHELNPSSGLLKPG